MEGKMKVAVMNGIGEMGFVEREIPKPAADEVLVKLEYVGICGSDMHYYETGAIGDYVVEPPFVLGHEPGGVVVEVGENVKHLQVGDRVALEPGKTCGHCEFCKQGNTTYVQMLFSLQLHRLTECSRNMWHMKQTFVSSFRIM